MKRRPHLIAVDAGSSDPGPYYLGAGVSFTDRGAVKRDLQIMLTAAVEHDIPVVVGTGRQRRGRTLDWCFEIVGRSRGRNNLHFPGGEDSRRGACRNRPAGAPGGPRLAAGPRPGVDGGGARRHHPRRGADGSGADPEGARGRRAGGAGGAGLRTQRIRRAAGDDGYDRGLAIHWARSWNARPCGDAWQRLGLLFGYLGEDYFRVEPLSKTAAAPRCRWRPTPSTKRPTPTCCRAPAGC
jgi:hypothetical protein